MMKGNKLIYALYLLILAFQLGCSVPSATMQERDWKPTFRVQAGINKGGIVDNVDMAVVPNTPVDGYSGATRTGFNLGARTLLPIIRNSLETGVDMMYGQQVFSYNNPDNGFIGGRKITTSQVMLPIAISIPCFTSNLSEGLFQFKIGYVAQLNYFAITDEVGELPSYTLVPFTNGATIGVSSAPLLLSNGAKLGLFIDLYRGTQAYEDFYNRQEYEMPGTSYFKMGIVYQF